MNWFTKLFRSKPAVPPMRKSIPVKHITDDADKKVKEQ